MEGIIGRRVLSDIFTPSVDISIKGEDPCLFHVHVIQIRHLFYNLVPVDFDKSRAIDE